MHYSEDSICRYCGEHFATLDGGYHYVCDDCRNEHKIASAKKYDAKNPQVRKSVKFRRHLKEKGLTEAQYAGMLSSQNGACAICGKLPGERRLSVDHCHVTGDIRGLLCPNCNTAIGMMNDSPAQLQAAAAYLKRWYR